MVLLVGSLHLKLELQAGSERKIEWNYTGVHQKFLVVKVRYAADSPFLVAPPDYVLLTQL